MTIEIRNGKYYCRFQIKGERHHFLCEGATSLKEAEQIENGFKYRTQQQQNGIIKFVRTVSFQKLVNAYIDYSKLNNKNFKADFSRLRKIQEYFKSKTYAKDIKPADVEKFKEYLLNKGLKKVTVNHYLVVLSMIFKIGIENNWIESSPVKRRMRFKVKHYVVRYLTADEEKRMFEAAPEAIKPLLIFALQTGLRRNNIIYLKWDNIDFNQRLIQITENKGNKHLKIPITDTILKILLKVKNDTEFVFINPQTNKPYSQTVLHRIFTRIKNKAGIKNFRFHDLRHTVGTRLANNNVPVHIIKEILGHSDVKTTMRYIHASEEEKFKALNTLTCFSL